MSEQDRAWDRQEGEPLNWFNRFERFRLMAPVRSIAAVFQDEQTRRNPVNPRTKVDNDWYVAAKRWQWEDRAAAWDAYRDVQIEEQIIAERKQVLRSHYALMHKRVQKLDDIVTKLIGYLDEEKNIWLPDVKAIGTGKDAERVDLVQFNAALFSEIRGHFGDIAAELGERIKKSEVKVKELPKVYLDLDEDEDGVDP